MAVMLTIIGLGIITSSNDEVSIAGNELNEMQAFYGAEGGLDKVCAILQAHYETTGIPPTTSPADTIDLNGVTIGYSTVPGALTDKVLTKDIYVGLRAYVRPYAIRSTAIDSSHSTAFTLEQTFQIAFIPLFQYGAFYDGDLEISTGTPMTMGRVHSNGNIYLQSSSNLQIGSYLSSSGNIYHGPKTGSGLATSTGDVSVKDIGGNMISMKDGGDWLDANDAYWFDSAAARWDGRVQDSDFGVENLAMPMTSLGDSAHMIIQPASAGGGNSHSLEHQADLKIIDGQAFFNVGGVWSNVTAPLIIAGAMVETTFHDKRENQDITVVDLDLNVLNASPYLPPSGIIYISDQRSGLRGARLVDADIIGMPMTVACENPVYTVGDVNTPNKVPFSIIADALTVLSDNWDDNLAKAASGNVNDRPATSTTLNLSFIAGRQETTSGTGYGGGLENLPRLLEDWAGRTMTFRGSMVSLWESMIATGNWSTSYYTQPIRDWAFDPALEIPANIPPGTPTARAYIRFGWKQKDVGYVASEFIPAAEADAP